MRAERLVIRNGFVVSMDPEIGEIPAADVLVEDGKIVDIGPALDVFFFFLFRSVACALTPLAIHGGPVGARKTAAPSRGRGSRVVAARR